MNTMIKVARYHLVMPGMFVGDPGGCLCRERGTGGRPLPRRAGRLLRNVLRDGRAARRRVAAVRSRARRDPPLLLCWYRAARGPLFQPEQRASDADRDTAVDILCAAVAEGRLTLCLLRPCRIPVGKHGVLPPGGSPTCAQVCLEWHEPALPQRIKCLSARIDHHVRVTPAVGGDRQVKARPAMPGPADTATSQDVSRLGGWIPDRRGSNVPCYRAALDEPTRDLVLVAMTGDANEKHGRTRGSSLALRGAERPAGRDERGSQLGRHRRRASA